MRKNGNIFFIVHDEDAFQRHPNLIGFYVKTNLDGKVIRDEKRELIPEVGLVSEIKLGDKIIYYTCRDYFIRGIFKVIERIRESDERYARDWSPTVQFKIEPLVKPKKIVDFRNLIFYGKDPLDMFKHLDNLKTQWGMSIGGKNYIKRITPHDYKLVEEAIKKTFEPEAKKEEVEVPEFRRKHLEAQFKLVKILKSYDYQVHVATADKYKIIEKGEEILESIPEFHSEHVCDITSRVDCVAFTEYNVPIVLAEIVDSIGTLTESLFRLNEVALVYPHSEDLKFYIVGPEEFRRYFDEKIESLTFKALNKAGCTFKSYDEIHEIFVSSQKRLPRL